MSLAIKDIVNVIINRQTVSKSVSDLSTIAILAKHTVFTEGFRVYADASDALRDGFKKTDYVYTALNTIFQQSPRPKEVIVGGWEGDTYTDALNNFYDKNGNWFYLISDAKEVSDKLEIADVVEGLDVMFVYDDFSEEALTTSTDDIFSQIKAKSYDHSFGIHSKVEQPLASAWVGYFSTFAVGYPIWIHKGLKGVETAKYSRTEMSNLKNKYAQFYTTVGKDNAVEGEGVTGLGEKIFATCGVIWLRVALSEAIWNDLYTNDRKNFTNAGIDSFQPVIYRVLSQGIDRGILSPDYPFEINMPSADDFTAQERYSGNLSKITFTARLAGAIIRVDPIQGTIYY